MAALQPEYKLVAPHPWSILSVRVTEAQSDHFKNKPSYLEDTNIYLKSQAVTDQNTFMVNLVSDSGIFLSLDSEQEG